MIPSWILEDSLQRFTLIGYLAQYGYISRMNNVAFLGTQPGIGASTLIWVSDPSITVVAATVTISAINSITVTSIPTTVVSWSTQFLPPVYADIIYSTEHIVVRALIPSVERKIKLDLTCSVSGAVSITHQLKQYGPEPLPSWLAINSLTDEITFTPPGLFTTTNYTFVVESVVSSGVPTQVQKLVILEVLPLTCAVENCLECQARQTQKCKTCKDGYELLTDLSTCKSKQASSTHVMSDEAQSSQVATQVIMGAGIAIGGAVSLLSMSSPQAIWMMVNQFQLLMLLPLTGAFIPQDIIDYLTGMSFTDFSFSFIPIRKISFIDNLYDDFDSNNGSLERNLNLFLNFSLIVIIHIPVVLICKKIMSKYNEGFKHNLARKLIEIFTFAIYIRVLVEAYHALLLSSIQGVKTFDTNGAFKIISLLVDFGIMALCASLL